MRETNRREPLVLKVRTIYGDPRGSERIGRFHVCMSNEPSIHFRGGTYPIGLSYDGPRAIRYLLNPEHSASLRGPSANGLAHYVSNTSTARGATNA